MKIEKVFIIVVFFFLIQVSFAQQNYLPGKIIQLNGDTVSGLIDYRDWSNNPKLITFKKSEKSKPQVFTSKSISGFFVNGERYVAATFNIEVSPTQTNLLTENAVFITNPESGFLTVLIDGKKSLYSFKDAKGKNNFYIKNDTVYELLLYKKYLIRTDKSSVVAENKRYIGQLTIYLSNENADVKPSLKGLSYRQKSLIKLFKQYYKITGNPIVYLKKKEKIILKGGVLAGLTFGTISFSGTGHECLTEADFNTSVNFATGGSFSIILPRNQRKWSIENEILFTGYNVHADYDNTTYDNRHIKASADVGYYYLKLYNLIRYRYPVQDNSYLFFNAGISNGIALLESNYCHKEITYYTITNNYDERAVPAPRYWEQGLVGGIGYMYKKLLFEVRLEVGNGMTDYVNLNSLTTKYFLLMAYQF